MDKNDLLLSFMAKACHYAQSHVGDPDAWSDEESSREQRLQCTSFQMACFLANNTNAGSQGVEWSIVIQELIATKLDENGMMAKSEEEWKQILSDLVEDYGGWK
jgi:hypothetical protein